MRISDVFSNCKLAELDAVDASIYGLGSAGLGAGILNELQSDNLPKTLDKDRQFYSDLIDEQGRKMDQTAVNSLADRDISNRLSDAEMDRRRLTSDLFREHRLQNIHDWSPDKSSLERMRMEQNLRGDIPHMGEYRKALEGNPKAVELMDALDENRKVIRGINLDRRDLEASHELAKMTRAGAETTKDYVSKITNKIRGSKDLGRTLGVAGLGILGAKGLYDAFSG